MKKIIKNAAVITLLAFILTGFCSVAAGAISADTNNDGITDISDCTHIQMYLAKYSIEYSQSFDVDGNGIVDINDVTYLQIELSRPNTSTSTDDTATKDVAEPNKPAPTSVELNENASALKVGNTLTLTGTVNMEAEAGALTWESSNPDVAQIVSESGNSAEIKAMKLGTATITVSTYNGVTASCEITVSGSAVRCLDVSTFQETIDFNKVKADGYSYVIIRAGYGKDPNQEDDLFAQNYKNAKAAGLKVGAYWYSYAVSVAEAEEEAQNCLASIKGKTFDLPVFYDIEDKCQNSLGKTARTDIADKFCSVLESNGFDTGVYSTVWGFENMDLNKLEAKYAIWLVQIDGDFEKITADVHQYTWKQQVSGIAGDVDCNYIYNLNIVK